MQKRKLGELEVSAMGLGCMGMSDFYGPRDEQQNLETLNASLDLGCTFLDTADMYGRGENEKLLAKILKTRRDEVVLATKFGITRGEGNSRGVNGRPEYVKRACDASLERLGVDHIDLYYQHRVDPEVPIEDTVGAMKALVEAGKVRYLGLSEAGPDTLRRAAKVHPITALQTEYSLWTRDPEPEILPLCRELNIGFVAYSPLGRGFLTGQIKRPEDLAEDDFRRHNPRFQGENFQKNLDLVTRVQEMAEGKGVTAAQLALAWVLHQGDDLVPIPGTRRVTRLEENLAALQITLTADELEALASLMPLGVAAGTRYPEAAMASIGR